MKQEEKDRMLQGVPDPAELDLALEQLAEDVPPVPADFHARWMQAVRTEAQKQESPKTEIPEEEKSGKVVRFSVNRWTRILGVAAAFVFLIGGTLLYRSGKRTLTTLEYQPEITEKEAAAVYEAGEAAAVPEAGAAEEAVEPAATREPEKKNDHAMDMLQEVMDSASDSSSGLYAAAVPSDRKGADSAMGAMSLGAVQQTSAPVMEIADEAAEVGMVMETAGEAAEAGMAMETAGETAWDTAAEAAAEDPGEMTSAAEEETEEAPNAAGEAREKAPEVKKAERPAVPEPAEKAAEALEPAPEQAETEAAAETEPEPAEKAAETAEPAPGFLQQAGEFFSDMGAFLLAALPYLLAAAALVAALMIARRKKTGR